MANKMVARLNWGAFDREGLATITCDHHNCNGIKFCNYISTCCPYI